MKCQKCGKDFNKLWESKKVYEGIDEHHNPPKFMMDKWEGEIINLCRKDHRILHDKILKIMFKHSSLFKPNKSEYWTWIKILPCNRKKVIDEVIKFTKKWVENDT